MGIEKYESEIKFIAFSQECVYNHLSNLKNLEPLFDLNQSDEIRKQYPNIPDVKLENFQATTDECSFSVKPVGNIGIRIIELEPFKHIKLTGNQAIPFQITCWIQLLPVDETHSKVRITLHAELNPMIKMLVGKHLKDGVNHIAEALSKLHYG